ncbi:hypothetical protein KGQ19_16000 [Catenulispora sp. NL8]|uniref:Uncharacterized protein n=1 Tax=Catenulispora pinistramenti TaxID=2705254 RepID=A0ABS5KQP9_9ACTN|nr:hypothetical protein [Catenulispora pinistramenti]MBS2548369.1 hypothetical protein [Catenulispora pinistramenti]
MKEGEVKGILGDNYLPFGIDQIVPHMNEQGIRVNRADEDQPEVAWVYERDSQGQEISVTFCFGSVALVDVYKKDDRGKEVRLVRINDQGVVVNRNHFGL